MTRIDTLSPSLASGMIGYVATGSGTAFWIGSVGMWFALTALFVIAAALSRGEDPKRLTKALDYEPAE